MSNHVRTITAFSVAVAAATVIAGCSGAENNIPVSPTAQGGVAAAAVVRQAEREFFEICKDYSGAVGPTATFDVSVDVGFDGDVDSTFTVSLTNGQCQDIWDVAASGAGRVTVTENPIAGYTTSYVKTAVGGNGAILYVQTVASNTVTEEVGDRGLLVVFTNTEIPTPPPPGNQGCTPGYWKQEQHFDSWPAPYTPTTLFSAVFEDAFPGMTLDQVVGQGGGGLNALGRHTVAALLNAQSSGVTYPISAADVISGFNAVFPGGNYETLHLRWAAFNEAGCPLN